MKNESWKRLCSLTHTGYQQIGARFTPEGLGYAYQESEILYALHWADTLALLVVVAFANLTENKPLERETLVQIRKIEAYAADVWPSPNLES